MTGATGYIGSRLVGELLDAGHQVVVTSRKPERLRAYGWFDGVSVVQLDAREKDSTTKAFDDAGQIVRQFGVELHRDAALLRQVIPLGVRELEHLLDDPIDVDQRERQFRFALTIEFTHARDSAGHVVDRTLNGRER